MQDTARKQHPSSSLDKAVSEVSRLESQYKRARERVRKIESELLTARKVVERERVKSLVGKPVKYGTWLRSTDRFAWLNNAVGTLQKVNRKRGVVDFGERGVMNIPIHDIQAADENRTTITLDAMGDDSVNRQWFDSTPHKESQQ